MSLSKVPYTVFVVAAQCITGELQNGRGLPVARTEGGDGLS